MTLSLPVLFLVVDGLAVSQGAVSHLERGLHLVELLLPEVVESQEFTLAHVAEHADGVHLGSGEWRQCLGTEVQHVNAVLTRGTLHDHAPDCAGVTEANERSALDLSDSRPADAVGFADLLVAHPLASFQTVVEPQDVAVPSVHTVEHITQARQPSIALLERLTSDIEDEPHACIEVQFAEQRVVGFFRPATQQLGHLDTELLVLDDGAEVSGRDSLLPKNSEELVDHRHRDTVSKRCGTHHTYFHVSICLVAELIPI